MLQPDDIPPHHRWNDQLRPLPGTYVTDNTPLRAGMRVTAFYDMNQPVPLIYPPQYQAAFIARTEPGENVMVAYFNERLLSSENPLQLNISPNTRVTTANGQRYVCGIGNNLLMVYYSATTRSIPLKPRRKELSSSAERFFPQFLKAL